MSTRGCCRVELPSVPVISLDCALSCEQFNLAGCEAELMTGIATEHIEGNATEVVYHRLDRARTERDPLYDEPIDLKFHQPFTIMGRVQKPTKATEANEKGQTTTWDAVVWVATASWPSGDPPKEGDVLLFWDVPYFRKESVRLEAVPGARYAYDVINVETDGHVNDTADFVAWEITCKRNTTFTPERRVGEL